MGSMILYHQIAENIIEDNGFDSVAQYRMGMKMSNGKTLGSYCPMWTFDSERGQLVQVIPNMEDKLLLFLSQEGPYSPSYLCSILKTVDYRRATLPTGVSIQGLGYRNGRFLKNLCTSRMNSEPLQARRENVLLIKQKFKSPDTRK